MSTIEINTTKVKALGFPDDYIDALKECGEVSGEIVIADQTSECFKQLMRRQQKLLKPKYEFYTKPPAATPAPKYFPPLMPKQPTSQRGWNIVETSWVKAWQFAAAAKSRGFVATLGDILGVWKGKGKQASDKTVSLRVLSCFGDDKQPACPALKYYDQGQFHYCNDCGCGPKERARLSSVGSGEKTPIFKDDDYLKYKYPELQCPRMRPGFSNELDLAKPCDNCLDLQLALNDRYPDQT
jgi:hypothetical protein